MSWIKHIVCYGSCFCLMVLSTGVLTGCGVTASSAPPASINEGLTNESENGGDDKNTGALDSSLPSDFPGHLAADMRDSSGECYTDTDNDGLCNEEDVDIDGDGKLNIVDTDMDGDGIININDNDIDGDGVANEKDSDIDGDGTSNIQDSDIDGDGIKNINDNDLDGDGIANEEDGDLDGDGIANADDGDKDGDGLADEDDTDIDGDGIANEDDNDIDGDGVANDGDDDDDGDGVSDQDDSQPDGLAGAAGDDPGGIGGSIIYDEQFTVELTSGKTVFSVTEKINFNEIRNDLKEDDISLANAEIQSVTVKAESSANDFLTSHKDLEFVLEVSYKVKDGDDWIKILHTPDFGNAENGGFPAATLGLLKDGIKLDKSLFISASQWEVFSQLFKDESVPGATLLFEFTLESAIDGDDYNLDLVYEIEAVSTKNM
ncbi:MAG: hypothetical protein HQK83_17895 [Fibrobacteria bacterium]|nr:hypothetical protein [Fibrobacteria bacterium]